MKDFAIWLIENKSELLACFLEILIVLYCVHGMFKSKFRFTIANVGIIALNMIVMILINMDIVGKPFVFVVYMVICAYCIARFKRKLVETIGRFLISLCLVLLVEVFASILAVPISQFIEVQESMILLINTIGILIMLLIFKLSHVRKKKIKLDFDKEKWGTLILVCGFGVLFIVIDYQYRGKIDQIYYFLFLVSCIIACVSSISSQAAKHELEKQKLELELQTIYGDTYKELLAEVRRKQHDYSNQLSAIYSMHLTAESLEDLIAKQSEYGKVLLEESRYDKILIGCNNPILAGYLYYRCVAYEKEGMQVDYQIHVDGAECCLSLHEVIEILGILLTNALEHCQMDDSEKRIGLIVEENAEGLAIEVSNQAEEVASAAIEEMFREGSSTKGENRGIGLARVKQLSAKVRADLIVENRIKENMNWVNFKVLIPKCEGE